MYKHHKMSKVFQYIKTMPAKEWCMLTASFVGIICLVLTVVRGGDVVAILASVWAIVPAAIWFFDFKDSQKLQQQVIKLKDKVDDIGIEPTYNPEWIWVITDSVGHILMGIKQDGSVDWYIGIPSPIRNELEAIKQRLTNLEK